MTNDEQSELIQAALREACEKIGVDPTRAAAEISLRVMSGGEVAVVDRITGSRRLSLYADKTWMDADEAVRELARTRPEVVTAAKPAGGTKFGVPAAVFDGLNATAKLALARKAGVTAPGPRKPSRRTPTVEEQAAMQGMDPIARMRFARQQGICT